MISFAGFCGASLAVRPVRSPRVARSGTVRVSAAQGSYQWLNKEPLALVIGFVGWFAPSNIGVQTFGGKSLFGAFMASIGENLANFPTPPGVTSNFWFLMLFWHVGLFTTLTLAQIGLNGRKQGYW
jgi:photosystem I subunit PsaO